MVAGDGGRVDKATLQYVLPATEYMEESDTAMSISTYPINV